MTKWDVFRHSVVFQCVRIWKSECVWHEADDLFQLFVWVTFWSGVNPHGRLVVRSKFEEKTFAIRTRAGLIYSPYNRTCHRSDRRRLIQYDLRGQCSILGLRLYFKIHNLSPFAVNQFRQLTRSVRRQYDILNRVELLRSIGLMPVDYMLITRRRIVSSRYLGVAVWRRLATRRRLQPERVYRWRTWAGKVFDVRTASAASSHIVVQRTVADSSHDVALQSL